MFPHLAAIAAAMLSPPAGPAPRPTPPPTAEWHENVCVIDKGISQKVVCITPQGQRTLIA